MQNLEVDVFFFKFLVFLTKWCEKVGQKERTRNSGRKEGRKEGREVGKNIIRKTTPQADIKLMMNHVGPACKASSLTPCANRYRFDVAVNGVDNHLKSMWGKKAGFV